MLLTRSADLNLFLQRKQPQWRRLELLLERVESESLGSLSPHDIREFGVLYRRASSDLVSARAKTANAEIIEYLNDLVARAYAQVYRTRRHRAADLVRFVAFEFPGLVRRCRAYVLVAAAMMLGASAFGYFAGQRDPSAAYYLLPPQIARVLPAARERLRQQTGHAVTPREMAESSGRILTNNIGVAFTAFAAGITFGAGTLIILLFNGFLLGIFASALGRSDTAVTFWSLILPHGIIELTAIFIAGGAGLMIGGALIAPGRRTRRDALMERGRLAVLLVLGTIPLFVIAGLIEGYVTPPYWIPPALKLAFAGLTAVGLAVYLGFAGRHADPDITVAEPKAIAGT